MYHLEVKKTTKIKNPPKGLVIGRRARGGRARVGVYAPPERLVCREGEVPGSESCSPPKPHDPPKFGGGMLFLGASGLGGEKLGSRVVGSFSG